jgi:hypothetical protein
MNNKKSSVAQPADHGNGHGNPKQQPTLKTMGRI